MADSGKAAKKKPAPKNRNWLGKIWDYTWREGRWLRRITFIILVIIFVYTAFTYSIGEWYIRKHKHDPLTLGTTFISGYAESFGLDPHETLNAIFSDLGMRQVRLVSYWNNIEPTQGTYDFSDLDWQFALANQYHAKISLSIGLRQPRWPECHEPSWVDTTKSESAWVPALNKYMQAVVDRYKNNPALDSYQLENEYFMTVFGECKNFDRSRLVNEFSMVKKLDPAHKIIVSRSDNWIGIPLNEPTPDEYGISVYKRVWDSNLTHRYFEYPLPAHFYAFLAGAQEIVHGKDMIIHEMQAEPWLPPGMTFQAAPLSEQYKSMNPERMKSRIEYAESTGMRTIDLWGAEWWYWVKVDKHDPGVWNAVKSYVAKAQAENAKLANNK
jgi:hypothetical protein